MKVRLKEQQRVEVKNGDFRRVFEAKDQPFEVTDEVWSMLRRTGEFEIVKEATPAQQQEEQRQEEQRQEGQQQEQQQEEQPGDAPDASNAGDSTNQARRSRQTRTANR